MMDPMMMMQMMAMSKGKGKGKKGKGKGKTPLRKAPVENRVWIGNIPEGCNWKDLQAHMDQAGKTKWVEPFKKAGKGTAGAAYSSPEEVANAVSMLNGKVFAGQVLQVDVWEKKEKA